jgi:hypothetical protein
MRPYTYAILRVSSSYLRFDRRFDVESSTSQSGRSLVDFVLAQFIVPFCAEKEM